MQDGTRRTPRGGPVRSVVAVILSFGIFAIASAGLFALRDEPHRMPTFGVLVSHLAAGVTFACAAGYSAALIARRQPIAHAACVAGIMALVAITSMVMQQPVGSHWSQWSTLLLMVPATLCGGHLKARGMGSAPAAFSTASFSRSDTRQGPGSA